jgi:hypothetical protein
MEIWKDIKNFEGRYQVSNTGKVRSLDRVIVCSNHKERCFKGCILSTTNKKSKYKSITLTEPGYRRTNFCHVLVASHFIDDIPKGMSVNHKDSNTLNNHVDNLEIVSIRDNTRHAMNKKDTSSRHIGVYWDKKPRKWKASIHINGSGKNLGRFKHEEDAKKAVDAFIKKMNIECIYG